MSRDPLGYVDGPNLYAFVRNSSSSMLDRLGLLGVFVNGTDVTAGDSTVINKLAGEYSDLHGSSQTFKFWNPTYDTMKTGNRSTSYNLISLYFTICRAVCRNSEEPIDLFGYSRGAVQALVIFNFINHYGCCCDDLNCQDNYIDWKIETIDREKGTWQFLGGNFNNFTRSPCNGQTRYPKWRYIALIDPVIYQMNINVTGWIGIPNVRPNNLVNAPARFLWLHKHQYTYDDRLYYPNLSQPAIPASLNWANVSVGAVTPELPPPFEDGFSYHGMLGWYDRGTTSNETERIIRHAAPDGVFPP